jgi:hypothetical protein
MKRIAILGAVGVGLTLMLTAAIAQPPGPHTPPPKPRSAVIHMTHNFNTKLYPASCLGTITTETLPSRKDDVITWYIRSGNAVNNDDVCTDVNDPTKPMDKSLVELHFKDNVMGNMVLKATQLNGNGPWVIQGTVQAMDGAHQYSVYFNNQQAGPDPEIEVACAECGGRGGRGRE